MKSTLFNDNFSCSGTTFFTQQLFFFFFQFSFFILGGVNKILWSIKHSTKVKACVCKACHLLREIEKFWPWFSRISASSSPAKSETVTKWVASTTLQRRWASEKIRKKSRDLDFSLSETEDLEPVTRFDHATESLLSVDRSACKCHAEYKRDFMCSHVLKVNWILSFLEAKVIFLFLEMSSSIL